MALFRRDPAKSLRKALGECELPTFPAATLEALDIIRDEEASLADVAKKLELDPELSVRVLRLVNSAGFGLRHAVDELPHAVQLVGRASLETLLISIGLREALPSTSMHGFDPARFWNAAWRRATTSRSFAARICPSEAPSMFTAGLLQDLAVPLLVQHVGEPYAQLLTSWREGGAELHEREREEFGWDHCEIGSGLCGRWGLPKTLATMVGSHHALADEEDELPVCLRLSALLREEGGEEGVDALLSAASELTDYDPETLSGLLETSFREAEAIAEQNAGRFS